MTRPRLLAATALAGAALLLAGCTGDPAPGPTSPTPAGTTAGSGVLEAEPPPTSEPPDDGTGAEETYGFAVPSSTVTVEHSTAQRAYLVGVYVGDHPEGAPAYQRISFYFRGDFPSYHFGYEPRISQEGTGDPVALDGAYFLSVVFTNAQAHDEATGSSTVLQAPNRPLGMDRLMDYAAAGDFEGQVSYGIGVAEAGDTAPGVRVGELKRSDNAGGYFSVVYVDIRAG